MSILNPFYIEACLTHSAHWCEGHGAIPDTEYMGLSLVYYALIYGLRAETCVCLGSGGGYVPRVMAQAQRGLKRSFPQFRGRVILVDANNPGARFGQPDWLAEDSFFRSRWPEIQIHLITTDTFAAQSRSLQIDYLHIDADHSRAAEDFELFRANIVPGGIVVFHDTKMTQVSLVVRKVMRAKTWQVIRFDDVGAGIAVCRKVGIIS